MADRMFPIPIEHLTRWILDELITRRSVFGLPEELFHRPWMGDPYACHHHGRLLETPLGVAAGPHTQLTQNIVSAYLAGARFIELKTVQTLDEIEVSKPCIDMQDVGYNCEWSQELTLAQSFDEYLKAWILIRMLREELDLGLGPEDGFLFNMSVGYNLDGIHNDNVQRFLGSMRDATRLRREALLAAARMHPAIADLDVPTTISESVTLSTMHGCPPEEIERIGRYLIEELGLHTAIKLNPTLLGPARLREILNGQLGFADVEVPDEAFGHDPTFADAVDIIRSLQTAADRAGVAFWVKLTNTLQTRNVRQVLPANEAMHYMSGRALHPLAVRLAADLAAEFEGHLALSLSGGADAFNLPALCAGGISPVTVCSDLLRPGGYGRLPQYLEHLAADMRAVRANSPFGFICRTALNDPRRKPQAVALVGQRLRRQSTQAGVLGALEVALESGAKSAGSLAEDLLVCCAQEGLDAEGAGATVSEVGLACAQINLEATAEALLTDERYRNPRRQQSTKTSSSLGTFDCIAAPCREGCPASQNVPDYMYLVARGRLAEALEVVLRDNPLPATTGAVCDHPCMTKCVRTHYDQALAIRAIKRHLTASAGARRLPTCPPDRGVSVAIVGAGPAGLAAAWFLRLAGFCVTVFDGQKDPGGMPAQLIPAYRLPGAIVMEDVEHVRRLGVDFRFGLRLGRDLTLGALLAEHRYVFLGIGAHQGLGLRIVGEDAVGVHDCLDFLTQVKAGRPPELGRRVLVIGGGNSAMDAARTAWRLVGAQGEVTLVYRRTEAQMPADDEELSALRDEGVRVRELTAPVRIVQRAGRVTGLECVSMELGPADDSGRPRPVPVEGSQEVLAADAVVVAIGQKPEEAALAQAGLALTKRGSLLTDDTTGETSQAGVFAGGDALRGGGSIIQAVADARRAVRAICRREGLADPIEPALEKSGSPHEFLVRKSRRCYPERLPQLPVEQRRGFELVDLDLSPEQARREASRCLDCDEFCGLCATVCPNRANLIYRASPISVELPELVIREGRAERVGNRKVQVSQKSQIVNLADACNECGNCQTFCPTQGAPYRDKPRLCLSADSFAAEQRAYRLTPMEGGFRIEFKQAEELHRLTQSAGRVRYRSASLIAELDVSLRPSTFGPGPEATEGDRVDLGQCIKMAVLGRSLMASAGFLPGLQVQEGKRSEIRRF